MIFHIKTLGCKVNGYESEALVFDLEERGWTQGSIEQSNVIIINTCTVTANSDSKSRQVLRKVRRENQSAIIVVMGCYSQLNNDEAEQLADIVIGTNNRLMVADLVKKYQLENQKLNIINNQKTTDEYEEMCLGRLTKHARGFVKIQDGCENFCSFCAIPFARGKVRSRSVENIIDEINNLVNQGVREVVISGINTGCYGIDLVNINLAKLVTKIMNSTRLYRLRISSIELMQLTDELIKTIKLYEKRIAMHLHIPLQGGHDTILKRMERKYTIAEYRAKIQMIRNIFPNIAITTDYMAGFVGETLDEFLSTCDFIQEMKFANMHIFPYSRRVGTKADQMVGHLNTNIINQRAQILQKIAKEMANKYYQQFINTIQNIIIERKKDNYYIGHSSNYLEIYVNSKDNLNVNAVVNVKITKIKELIYGEVVEVINEF